MPSHEPLVKKANQGNYDAFEQLVDRYKDGVYRISVLILGNIHEGLDAAEESFVRGYRSLQKVGNEPLFFQMIYRQAVDTATALRKKLSDTGIPWMPDSPEEFHDPLTILTRFDADNAQILLLYEIEDLVPEDVAAILDMPVDHIRETLSRARGSEASSSLSGAITELRKLSAPPGFSAALRDRLKIEADLTRSMVTRRWLLRGALVFIMLMLIIAGGGIIYQRNTGNPASTVAVDEAIPQERPAPSVEASPDLPVAPLHDQKETAAKSIPVILLSGPSSADISLEDIATYIQPRLRSPMEREGGAWIVEANADQFWSMHRWLKVFYSRMRMPERAIPKGVEYIRIRLKVVEYLPKPVPSSSSAGQ